MKVTHSEKNIVNEEKLNKKNDERMIQNPVASGRENQTEKNMKKPEVRGKNNSNQRTANSDQKRTKYPEPGPRRKDNINSGKEIKKEQISEEIPAGQDANLEGIKTEPRDQSCESEQPSTEQKASLTFQTVQKNGNRKIRVKIDKLKTLNQQIWKLMRKFEEDAGLGPNEAVWVSGGKRLSGEETGQSLDGKVIVLKKLRKI